MTELERLEELRTLFLGAPESTATRTLAVIGSLLVAAVVLHLVRRRKLREEYTPIWLGVSLGLLMISLVPNLLMMLTELVGAWTPSSTIFFMGEIFLLTICLNFAVRLSRTSVQIRSLGREIAILRARLDAVASDRSPAS